ncbi:hypothetical protein Dimus_023395 [Dionaea muscipula]
MANPDDGIAESDAPSQADVKSICGRRIDFQLERKPYNPVGKTSNFMLETLNPSASSSSSNLQPCSSFKKPDSLDLLENGLDPLFTSRITFRRIGAGLANLGNTCFLNSVLQCLTYTEPLAAYLQSGKHKNSCRMIGFCALCAIQSHVSHALQAPGRILVPKDLVSNLRCISRNFHNARQEDAHEYMIHLLESMHKCCLPSGVPTESPTAYEKSLVHKIFGGRLRSRVKCLQCFNCSDKFDPFLDLSLEILKTDSLNKALLHFIATEKLDDGEQQYLCEKCKEKVKALKQLTVDKAPYVLTIHLKRFGSHFSGQKIDRKVHFGPALDLKPFVSGSYVDGDLRYTLYGVLVHAGGSTHSGHYYCFVRTSSGMWYSLDDNEVVQVSERIALDQKAYVLFYVRDRNNFAPKKLINASRKADVVATTVRNAPTTDPDCRPIQNGFAEKLSNGLLSKSFGTVGAPDVLVQKDVSIVCSTQSVPQDESVQKCIRTIFSQDSIVRNENALVSKSEVEDAGQLMKRTQNNSGTCNDAEAPVTTVDVHSKERNSNKNPESVVKASSFRCPLNIADNADCKDPQKMEDSDAQAGVCCAAKNDQCYVMIEKTDSDHQSSDKLDERGICKVEGSRIDLSVSVKSTKIPNLNGTVTAASSHQILGRKLKHKKCKSTAMHFGPNMMYRASYSIRKRKKGKKKKAIGHNLAVERLLDDGCTSAESAPSTSERTSSISLGGVVHSFSRSVSGSRKTKKGADEQLKERIDHGNDVLGADLQSLKSTGSTLEPNLLDNWKLVSLKDSLNCQVQTGKESIVALDLETAAVGQWDGVELTSSKNLESNGSRGISIGYVADEW